jgi:hypothetical protein
MEIIEIIYGGAAVPMSKPSAFSQCDSGASTMPGRLSLQAPFWSMIPS